MDALVNGKPVLFRITVPEGLTWWQTGRLLEEAGLVRFADFRDVVTDPDFLRHYGIPFATAEGFLMPDTYLLKKTDEPDDAQFKAQARAVAGRMVDNFWRKTAAVWPGKARPKPDDLKKWVILASVVEKETAIDAERPRVAGVYRNRLARQMLLQADPTVIYGMGPAFDGNLRRKDLDDPNNPYNTYQRPGLPPGPICSFGTAAWPRPSIRKPTIFCTLWPRLTAANTSFPPHSRNTIAPCASICKTGAAGVKVGVTQRQEAV